MNRLIVGKPQSEISADSAESQRIDCSRNRLEALPYSYVNISFEARNDGEVLTCRIVRVIAIARFARECAHQVTARSKRCNIIFPLLEGEEHLDITGIHV